MTQELAIAASDQVTPLAKEAGDGKAGRGDLPFIAVQVTGTEQDLGDLLLGRAMEGGVGGLKDTPQARFLLRGQAGVAGDGSTSMLIRQEPLDCFDAVEPLEAERNGGHKPTTVFQGSDEMQVCPVRQPVAQVLANGGRPARRGDYFTTGGV